MMKNIQRKNYIWNTAAGALNAAEAVIMSMIVTRFGKLSDAGILSLAFATGNVLMTIGKFGGRIYQVTDAEKQYSFRMYLIQRLFSLGLMLASLGVMLVFSDYSAEKAYAVILIALIYLLEAFEDCIWGQYQVYDRLYIGAEMFIFRWSAILIVFFAEMIRSHNMTRSLLYGATAGCVVFAGWLFFLIRDNQNGKYLLEYRGHTAELKSWLPGLFKQTVPLFIAAFCSIFISNIPKFAINHYLSDEVQACYGFVAMPVFVIGLLNQFIYQPTVVSLTDDYTEGKIDIFMHRVKKQMLIVAGISAVCILGAGLIGTPVLSLVYHTELSGYRAELLILQVAGGFLALAGYFTVVLTLMRKQRTILAGYAAALALSIPVLLISVRKAGTVGASIGYTAVMLLLFAFYYAAYRKIISRKQKEG